MCKREDIHKGSFYWIIEVQQIYIYTLWTSVSLHSFNSLLCSQTQGLCLFTSYVFTPQIWRVVISTTRPRSYVQPFLPCIIVFVYLVCSDGFYGLQSWPHYLLGQHEEWEEFWSLPELDAPQQGSTKTSLKISTLIAAPCPFLCLQ
jgi:hypothetical protein